MARSPTPVASMGELQLAVILALIASTYSHILVAPPTYFVPPVAVEVVRLHVIIAANVLLLVTAFCCWGDVKSAVFGVTMGIVYGGLVLAIIKWLDVDPLSFSAAANVVTDNLGKPLICVSGTAAVGFFAGFYRVKGRHW